MYSTITAIKINRHTADQVFDKTSELMNIFTNLRLGQALLHALPLQRKFEHFDRIYLEKDEQKAADMFRKVMSDGSW
jgi:hypothetical protein